MIIHECLQGKLCCVRAQRSTMARSACLPRPAHPSHLCSPSPFTSSPLERLAKPRRERRRIPPTCPPALSVWRVCVCFCMYAGRESIKKEGKTEIINSATCFARGADRGDILHMNAAPFSPSLQAFDLDIAGSPEPPRVCFCLFLSLSLCSLHFLVLSSSLQLSGWRACSLGVFRLWRDPNFLF